MSTPFVVRTMSALHGFWYRVSGGRLGGRFGKAPVLLLRTTGRKSGKARETPLMYVMDGESYALMASNGGRATHPLWYLNLLANPAATIRIGAAAKSVRAETAGAEQAAQLWPRFSAIYKGYDGYRKQTTREIPIVLLRPG